MVNSYALPLRHSAYASLVLLDDEHAEDCEYNHLKKDLQPISITERASPESTRGNYGDARSVGWRGKIVSWRGTSADVDVFATQDTTCSSIRLCWCVEAEARIVLVLSTIWLEALLIW